MIRRGFAAFAVLFVLGGFVLAETYEGRVTKFDKDELTITIREKGKKGKGTEKTLKVDKDVKITKKVDDKNEDVTVTEAGKLAEKKTKIKVKDQEREVQGFTAKVTTEGEGDKEKVTKVEITTGGRRKKQKDDK